MQKENTFFFFLIVIPFQRNFEFQPFVTFLLQTRNAELSHSKKIVSAPCMAYSEMQTDLTGGIHKARRNVIKIHFSVHELHFTKAY